MCDPKEGRSMAGVIVQPQKPTHYQEVRKRLEIFVTFFVHHFEEKIRKYEVSMDQVNVDKSDNMLSVRGIQVTTGVAGALITSALFAKPTPGLIIGSASGRLLGLKVRNALGTKTHIAIYTCIEHLIAEAKANRERFRRVVVEAGYDVFQSYELQLTRCNTLIGPAYGLNELARVAVNRAFDYIRQSRDFSISEGVVHGKSKRKVELTYSYQSSDLQWYTNSVFEKPGLKIVERNSHTTFYTKKGARTSKYGYRRILLVEQFDERMRKQYSLDAQATQNGQFVEHDFVLDKDEWRKESDHLLEVINARDPDRMEVRLAAMFRHQTELMAEQIGAMFRREMAEYEARAMEREERLLQVLEVARKELAKEGIDRNNNNRYSVCVEDGVWDGNSTDV